MSSERGGSGAGHDKDEEASPRRPVQLAFLVLLGGVLSVGVWTALALFGARGDLMSARDDLQALRGGDGPAPTLAQTRDTVAGAESRLRSAQDRLDGAGPRIVGRVPLLGRWVNGPRAVTEAGLAVVGSTGDVLDAVGDDDLLVDGALQLPRLRLVQAALEAAAEQTRGPVQQLRATRTGMTPGPLAGGVRDAVELLGPLPDALADGGDALLALDGVLGGQGERQVAVVLANNAEQRGAGGVVTVFAQGTARDGALRLNAFRDVFDVADPPGRARRVPAPSDYHELYGPYLADTTIWRNVSMSPDGPSWMGVLSQLSRTSTGVPTDVVISLDVRAIAAVLGATGPTRLPDGSELTAETAVQELLLDAYTRFPDTVVGQTQRRTVLRGAADAVVGRLLDGAADPVALGRALSGAAQGRHLSVWSARPAEQEALVRSGLAGSVQAGDGDLVQVATQNFGQATTEGNKLDFFVRRRHSIQVVLDQDVARVTQDFTLNNDAPTSDLPGYVLGVTRPGELTTLLGFAVPRGAVNPTLLRDGVQVVAPVRTERDHGVLNDVVTVPGRKQATWRLTYELPLEDGEYTLTVLPQALAFDASLDVDLAPLDGWRLESEPDEGLTRAGGRLRLSTPLETTQELRVRVVRDTLPRRAFDGIKRFWNEPVDVPG